MFVLVLIGQACLLLGFAVARSIMQHRIVACVSYVQHRMQHCIYACVVTSTNTFLLGSGKVWLPTNTSRRIPPVLFACYV